MLENKREKRNFGLKTSGLEIHIVGERLRMVVMQYSITLPSF